ncbi:MAG: AbrB/MazE/SpoVT family DNA-binding domain-containing protein [Hormoscilla sp. GUM202]|nr:AbrB/MazE/SpoVT family DNA-binding domain-containing protein [Hormoscilla sp. GUM202]
MENQTQIDKWGNSLALRIPKHISDRLGLKVNDTMICRVENSKLVLYPRSHSPEYSLDELLAGEIEDGGEEIYWGKPEGEEVW